MPCPNTALKLPRVRTIIDHVFAATDSSSHNVTAWGENRYHSRTMIKGAQGWWHADITEDQRITMGFLTENSVGERRLEAPGSRLFELVVRDNRLLAANLSGDQIDLHYFKPGVWEGTFGADPAGDTITFERWLFANPSNPDWQAFLRSDDAQLPPLRQTMPTETTHPWRRRQKRVH